MPLRIGVDGHAAGEYEREEKQHSNTPKVAFVPAHVVDEEIADEDWENQYYGHEERYYGRRKLSYST